MSVTDSDSAPVSVRSLEQAPKGPLASEAPVRPALARRPGRAVVTDLKPACNDPIVEMATTP
jgi:hypothetical protein